MTNAIPGIENLALMHSLPFALLVWAYVLMPRVSIPEI
jgi:hypothetical protein